MLRLQRKSPGKEPMRVSRAERSGMGTYRSRNRCLLGAMVGGFFWVFFVYRFVSNGHSQVPGSEYPDGNYPILKREQRDTLKSRFTSRDALSHENGNHVWKSSSADVCSGRHVYIYDLPREFNEGLLDDCEKLVSWDDMCKEIVNKGFGEPMVDPEGVFSESGWYSTNQFNLEIIFHERVKRDKCRTMDSANADLFFVPFYAGFEVMPHLWNGADVSHRDQVPQDIANWLMARPEWSRMQGHDHFFIGGRVTWDFRRVENDWGNNLSLIDAIINMTMLTIEASPWHSNDVAIPYPTYFHPSSDSEVEVWQDRVTNIDRKSLFCFAGAPRPEQEQSIRAQIMAHCKESEHCDLMQCGKTAGKCHAPTKVMRLFQNSHFCLQPAGDSYTRRSVFDSILAGCIPVFFHEYSAYTQYDWFFPADHASYSVFIHGNLIRAKNVSIEEVLLAYSPEQIAEMRSVVVGLIPHIVYGQLENNLTSKDAYEMSMDGIVDRVRGYQEKFHQSLAAGKTQSERGHKDMVAAKQKLNSLLRAGVLTR